MNTTAAIIIAPKDAFGMKKKYGVKNKSATITSMPVYNPPSGVRTPLELLTALRDSDPLPGNPCTNELQILQIPIAINSCVASTCLPLAKIKIIVS